MRNITVGVFCFSLTFGCQYQDQSSELCSTNSTQVNSGQEDRQQVIASRSRQTSRRPNWEWAGI